MNAMENKTNIKMKNRLFNFITSQEFILFIFIIVLIAFIGIISNSFFTLHNFFLIFRQLPIGLVVALGMTLSILSGGMDLSVGAILAAASLITGLLIEVLNIPLLLVVSITLLISSILGFINGILIAKLKVEPIIVTLGTMTIFRGIAYVLTNGLWFTNIPKSFSIIGQGLELFSIGVIITIILMVITKKTRFGKHVYAIGCNENAAKLAGIKVDKIKIAVYIYSGLLCGIAGLMYVARTATASVTAGSNYEMNAIAACVIGGINITGGKGEIIGTFFGVILMAVIFNGMTLMGISADWQGIVTSIIIILALLVGSVRRKIKIGEK